MKDFENEFQRVKKYRYLPGLPLLTLGILGAIKYIQGNTSLGNILIIIAIITCLYMSTKYKCPNCKYILDTRTSLRNLNHCPKCGVKLQSPKFYRY